MSFEPISCPRCAVPENKVSLMLTAFTKKAYCTECGLSTWPSVASGDDEKDSKQAIAEWNELVANYRRSEEENLRKPKTSSTPRGNILNAARHITENDRNAEYGDPVVNMASTGRLIEAYLDSKTGGPFPITAMDAAIILCLVKISRLAVGRAKEDTFVDLAAYAAIAGECAMFRDALWPDPTPETEDERWQTQ